MSIITLPSAPECCKFRWNPESAVMGQESEFTYKKKVYAWDGQRRSAQVEYPPMSFANAKIWQATMYKLNGIENTFYLKDSPIGRTLRGVGTGNPLIKGASQTGTSLITDGWSVSTTGILKQGDWISIGDRLFTILDDANTNSSGEATLNIWPKITTAYADNAAISVGTNARGIFRLTAWPDFLWDVSRLMTGFSMGVEELV